MKVIIKTILNIFDFFTQKKIINEIKSVLNTDTSVSLIDVGSHKGEYISSIKKNFLIDKIYGFEPNDEIFKNLNKNFSSDKIQIYNCGVSNKKGEVFLNKNIFFTKFFKIKRGDNKIKNSSCEIGRVHE